jgi:hypothetical protein
VKSLMLLSFVGLMMISYGTESFSVARKEAGGMDEKQALQVCTNPWKQERVQHEGSGLRYVEQLYPTPEFVLTEPGPGTRAAD